MQCTIQGPEKTSFSCRMFFYNSIKYCQLHRVKMPAQREGGSVSVVYWQNSVEVAYMGGQPVRWSGLPRAPTRVRSRRPPTTPLGKLWVTNGPGAGGLACPLAEPPVVIQPVQARMCSPLYTGVSSRKAQSPLPWEVRNWKSAKDINIEMMLGSYLPHGRTG